MRVLRVSFVATRTEAFDETRALFGDVLGMETAFENPGWVGFKLPSGERDLLEVFDDAMTDERVAPVAFERGVLIAFLVEDILEAREELAAAGVELVGEVVWGHELTGNAADEGWGWFFFRAPDGTIYVIQQDAPQPA